MELHRFLVILDKETLSGNATVQKGLLSDLLQSYRASTGKSTFSETEMVKATSYSFFFNNCPTCLEFNLYVPDKSENCEW